MTIQTCFVQITTYYVWYYVYIIVGMYILLALSMCWYILFNSLVFQKVNMVQKLYKVSVVSEIKSVILNKTCNYNTAHNLYHSNLRCLRRNVEIYNLR